VPQRVSISSVAPTLLELAGLAVPSGLDEASLGPLLRGGAEAESFAIELENRALIAHRVPQTPKHATAWAVMQGRWKLIDEGGRVELYDIEADPSELVDVASSEEEVVDRLRLELVRFQQSTRPVGGETLDVRLDAGTVEALRELGYVE
jgi:arylsulfatase A-like enzyme